MSSYAIAATILLSISALSLAVGIVWNIYQDHD